MNVTPDEFKEALLNENYDAIRSAIEMGFDVNTTWRVGRPSFVQIAQTMKNMIILKMLWEAGAVPETPWLEDLFKKFADGVSHESNLVAIDPCAQPGTLDLTENFTVSSLEFIKGIFDYSIDNTSIEIIVKPFILDNECVQTSVRADRITLPRSLDDLAGRTFTFPRNPEEGYIDASMYLRDAHNPVFISLIQFGDLSDDKNQIDAVIQMFFDFEDEMIGFPNESLTLSISLSLRNKPS